MLWGYPGCNDTEWENKEIVSMQRHLPIKFETFKKDHYYERLIVNILILIT